MRHRGLGSVNGATVHDLSMGMSTLVDFVQDRVLPPAPELTQGTDAVNPSDPTLSPSFAGPMPSWDYSLDVLDGFEQYMDTTPNVPAASFAAQGFSSAADAGTAKEDSLDSTPQQLSSSERRQHKNKMAQKRFRQRQKAS